MHNEAMQCYSFTTTKDKDITCFLLLAYALPSVNVTNQKPLHSGPPEAICGWSGPVVGSEVIIFDLAMFQQSGGALLLHFSFKLGA